LEKTVEQRVVDRAVECGYLVFKLQFIGVSGAPDRIFGRGGSTLAVEFKRRDKEPTRQQLLRAADLDIHFGWSLFWTDDYAEACQFLNIPE
jgi:hypothetical protein